MILSPGLEVICAVAHSKGGNEDVPESGSVGRKAKCHKSCMIGVVLIDIHGVRLMATERGREGKSRDNHTVPSCFSTA